MELVLIKFVPSGLQQLPGGYIYGKRSLLQMQKWARAQEITQKSKDVVQSCDFCQYTQIIQREELGHINQGLGLTWIWQIVHIKPLTTSHRQR